jgi:hypothetical protein
MRLCALDTIHHAVYNKLETKPPNALHSTLRSMLRSTDCTRLHTPSLLDCTLPSKFSRHSQVHLRVRSQVHLRVALKYTLEHALQYAPNCTRWHTPSLLGCTLPSKLSRRSQVHLRVRSQVHSRACSQVSSQLHSMAHSQPTLLYAPNKTLMKQDTPNLT